MLPGLMAKKSPDKIRTEKNKKSKKSGEMQFFSYQFGFP